MIDFHALAVWLHPRLLVLYVAKVVLVKSDVVANFLKHEELWSRADKTLVRLFDLY